MKEQAGFVLPVVLLFIQIYALLGISALEQVFLEQKLLVDQKSARLLFNEAESTLARLAASVDELSQICSISHFPRREQKRPALQWWLSHSCSDKWSLFRAYYVVEKLGADPCAQIRGGKASGALYYRLTLLLMKEQDEGQRVALQTTVVRESPNLEHCDRQPHSVDLGAQSWHQLNHMT